MPKLVSYSYKRNSNLLEIQAIVENAIQVAPATATDPPHFSSALCKAVLLWYEPISHANAPTGEEIERLLAWIPQNDWYAIPPIFSDDE